MSSIVLIAVLVVVIVVALVLARALREPPAAAADAADTQPVTKKRPVTAPRAGMPIGVPPSPPIDDLGDDDDDDNDKSSGHERMLVTAIGMTDPGLRRHQNEDAYVCLNEQCLYAIADGMGMHAAGEIASKLTIEAISDAFLNNMFVDEDAPDTTRARRKRLVRVIERANEIVLAMASELDAYRGMGTTVVVAHFSASKHRAHIAHVGDSRCYRLRGSEILQLTVDHTLGNIGIMGKTSSILSRAVGIEPNVEVDVITDRAEIGDVYLLCSDGLSRMTTDDKILQTVQSSADLKEATSKLITLAKEGGGRDNVTTILVRVDAATTP